ncbi:MAG: DUF2085 domain-containing protein [Clostridium sp.]|nr:DUF2085 domain-containing protein [Clostridium sp.]
MLYILFMCHRKPERSFFFRGKQFPLCARCTGIAVGYLVGILTLIFIGKLPLWVIPLVMLPMIVDGLLQNIWKIMSNNPRRFVTGVAFGAALIHAFWWLQLFFLWAASWVVLPIAHALGFI